MRLTPLALASLLMISMAPFQAGLAHEQEPTHVLILDDGEDPVVRYVTADVVMHGGGGGDGCAEQAPRVTHCTTGQHASIYTHGIFFPLCTVALEMGACYAGRVESVLTDTNGNQRILRVDRVKWLNFGIMDIPDNEGSITPGLAVTHDCHSYNLRQSIVEGGLGDFGCYVIH